jgi:hypothetical protein
MPEHDVSPFVRFQLLARFAAHTGEREKSEALVRQAMVRLQAQPSAFATGRDLLPRALEVAEELLEERRSAEALRTFEGRSAEEVATERSWLALGGGSLRSRSPDVSLGA